jgi:DNA-binding helix-hairpin-helix protein with protein kinase domain
MRRITDHRPLHELYRPQDRKQHFPEADYRFLVRTATNLAAAVHSVHAADCVIGDINESGILVKRSDATVSLVDADSFQVKAGQKTHHCRVIKDEYRPPELSTQRIESFVLNPNHDAFGLAVLIFQLLFMGRHPFSGTPQHGEMPMAQAIRECCFAYSLNRDVGLKPPQPALLLQEMPTDVAQAFERAFQPAKTTPRPTPQDWVEKLKGLEKQLEPCRHHARHYYPAHLSQCPLCRIEGSNSIFFAYSPGPAPEPARAKAPVRSGPVDSDRKAKTTMLVIVLLCATVFFFGQ